MTKKEEIDKAIADRKKELNKKGEVMDPEEKKMIEENMVTNSEV